MGLLLSLLILLLNLVILGAVYWGAKEIVRVLPFIPENIKVIVQTVLKVIFVIIAVVWTIGWLIGLLGGGGALAVPMFYQRR